MACSAGNATSSIASTSTTVESTTTTFLNPFLDLAEEPSNFSARDVVSVVGLPVDEKAWVGSFPADDVEFFGNLWPFDRLDAGLISLGEAASYDGGPAWEKVSQNGKEDGYFPQEMTGVLGLPEDITNEAADLVAASADELLTTVANSIAEKEAQQSIQITLREFGGREVYFDLIGGTDPATRGQRLRVVVEEYEEGFRVTLVESRIICVSRLSDAGTCSQ
jgi:hypothetical protein